MCLCVGLCSGLCSLDNVWGIDMYRIAIAERSARRPGSEISDHARPRERRATVRVPHRQSAPHDRYSTPLDWKRAHGLTSCTAASPLVHQVYVMDSSF
jgi:hypothetical protein